MHRPKTASPPSLASNPKRQSKMTPPPSSPAPFPQAPAEAARQARLQIQQSIVHTPTHLSKTLSELTAAELWLKFENLQYTASFKERGALNKLLSLTEEERQRGVVAASAGNHAQAVAHHARRLGIAATIVMPVTTPFIKVNNTEVLGAQIVQFGDTVDAARQKAAELAEQEGFVPIPPFDDPLIIAGQGTIALELLEDMPLPEVVVVPVGGGGLISGIAGVLKALQPQVQVVGVQAERFCAMTREFDAHHRAADAPTRHALRDPSLGPLCAETLADGIAVKTPGEATRQIILSSVDEMVTVHESSIERACNLLLEIEKTVAEGAGAASLAAVLQHAELFRGRRTACIISGGNMDPRVMADTILRGLARTGRLCLFRVDAQDLPGSLAEITRTIADAGGNIVEVVHERIFLTSPERRTRLSIEVATRHSAHAEQIANALRGAGHEVEVV